MLVGGGSVINGAYPVYFFFIILSLRLVAFSVQDRISQDLIDGISCSLVPPDTSIAAMYHHTPLPCPDNPLGHLIFCTVG